MRDGRVVRPPGSSASHDGGGWTEDETVEANTTPGYLIETGTSEGRLVELLRSATAILIASLVVGLVLGGIGARILMLIARLLAPERRSLVTEAGAVVGEVTFGGTAFLIVFVGILTAVAIGVTIAVASPWVGWARRAEGLLLGFILLVVYSPTILDPGNFDFLVLGDEVVTVGLIVAMFVGCGVAAVFLRDRLLRRLPVEDTLGRGSAYLPAGILGLVGVSILFVGLAIPDAFGMDAFDPTTMLFFLLTALSIAVWIWWVRTGSTPPIVVRILGYGTLVAIVVVGGQRLIDDVARIVP